MEEETEVTQLAQGPAPKIAAKKSTTDSLFQVDQEKWILHRNVQVPVSELSWDLEGTRGQARPFSLSSFEVRKREFEQVLPTKPVDVLLWPEDSTGMICVLTLDSFPVYFQEPRSGCWVVPIAVQSSET